LSLISQRIFIIDLQFVFIRDNPSKSGVQHTPAVIKTHHPQPVDRILKKALDHPDSDIFLSLFFYNPSMFLKFIYTFSVFITQHHTEHPA